MPPTGYGAAWNTQTAAKELLLSSLCMGAAGQTVTYAVGTGDQNHYIYKLGYYYQAAWKPFTLTGAFVQNSTEWLSGKGTYGNSAPPATDYFWVAYICQWTGTTWKCGCKDAACTQVNWQLQGVKYPPIFGGATGAVFGPTGDWVPFPPGSSGSAQTSVLVSTFIDAGDLISAYMAETNGTALPGETAQALVAGPLSGIFPSNQFGSVLKVENSGNLELRFTNAVGTEVAVPLSKLDPDQAIYGTQRFDITWPETFVGESTLTDAFLRALVSKHFRLPSLGSGMETDLTGYW